MAVFPKIRGTHDQTLISLTAQIYNKANINKEDLFVLVEVIFYFFF